MKFIKAITILFLFFAFSNTHAQSAFDKMTNDKMNKILLRESTKVEGSLGRWQVEFKERVLVIITDEKFNRMRIISPVENISEMKEKDFKLLLESNFDKALDAKYAIFEDLLWSTFTHPLNELTVEQFKDAMSQVVNLSKTYGSTYSSTDFVFGAENSQEGGN